MNNLSFLKEIEGKSGETISACYQCYKCTTGCPVARDMDIYPHRIIRHIILGDREKVLSSAAIWTCLQCTTCSVRCPNDIDIAGVFDTLRKIAIAENRSAEKDTWVFYQYFLDSVKKHGRLHELEAIMRYKVVKKNFFGDTKMGLGMFAKGRMGILPHNINDRKSVRNMFEKIEGEHGEKRK